MKSLLKRDEKQEQSWLRLDNAAKIYPASANSNRPLVFRLMAEIDRPVSYSALEQALHETLKRYPYFNVQIRKGFFWYWMDFDSTGVMLVPDQGMPCRYFRSSQRQQAQLRVLTKKNQISAEFFHALTDGSGALTFMRFLIYSYARIIGYTIPETSNNPLISSFDPDEHEDAYNKYFDPNLPPPPKLSKAYHLPFPKKRPLIYRVLSAEIPTQQVHQAAKNHGITITEYLTSIYLWALQDIYHKIKPRENPKKRSVIRVQVPVNLRNYFPSKSLRNFTLFVVPEIDMRLGFYTFEDLTRIVHYYMQLETDPKLLKRIIYRNVRNEKSWGIRLIPLLLKNMVLRYFFHRSGTSLYSGLITNLGRVQWEGDLKDLVERMRFYPPPPDQTLVSIGMITNNDRMVITFGNTSNTRLFERIYLGYMTSQNIPVKILNS